VIALSGPQDVGGVVAVTMTFDGTWGGPGANQSWVQMQSGPGFDGVGFASSNQSTMGLFSYIDNLLYGDRVDQCINCTYTLGDKFTFAITSFLPFLAGAQTVQYAAQIEISTQGAFIDGSHTATFSIDVPNGFTYSSALNFTDSIGSVPEPATLALVGFALAAIPAASARRRRR
jgi:hypothetical protein